MSSIYELEGIFGTAGILIGFFAIIMGASLRYGNDVIAGSSQANGGLVVIIVGIIWLIVSLLAMARKVFKDR